jgi:cytosine/adenosine deaminase-related metal-dependent hydrolase
MKRRDFLDMLLASGAALLAAPAVESQERGFVRAVPRARRGTQILVKGGTVLSLDTSVGDFDMADVLIDGETIAAVGPHLTARADARVVDASHAIVMPGFIDTHRHLWEGSLRNVLPNGLLSDYTRDITGAARAVFRPDDAYAGDLVSALGAINAGVTTVLDWSHIGNSPEHTDAAIAGLRDSSIRAVYAYGGGTPGPKNQFPADIRRLRTRYFSTSDQLLTLAMATTTSASDWALAREVGAPITLHVNGAGTLVPMAASMRSDCTYIHCDNLSEEEWRLIASTGGHVSISGPIEMEMGHGVPPFQQALAHGIRPSLSVDVETQMPGDLFTQMRTAFTLQRMQVLARERAGEKNLPKLLTVREVVEFATVHGAKANALDAKVGTLTPGKQADIVLLRHDRPNVLLLNNAYGAVVLEMDTSNVDTVFIAGTMVKSGGQLVGVDVAKVGRLAEQSRDYIVSKTGWSTSRVR